MEIATKRIALVTGASSGMGADFVRLLDEAGGYEEIWFCARREDRLEALAAELKKSRPVPLALDLTTAAGLATLAERLAAEKPLLGLLVENAGYGKFGDFAEAPLEEGLGMLELNVRVLTELARLALPYLGRGSGILLVSSLAGLMPIGGMAVYAASKAYVASFGAALGAELAERGIRVTTLFPGPVATEFFQVAGKDQAREPRGAAPSRLVAERALRDLGRGRASSYPLLAWKLAAIFAPLLPRSLAARAGRLWARSVTRTEGK